MFSRNRRFFRAGIRRNMTRKTAFLMRGEGSEVEAYANLSHAGAERIAAPDGLSVFGVCSVACDRASGGRKSLFLARILLRRGPSVGRAGGKNFLARRRPSRGAGVVHIKTRR